MSYVDIYIETYENLKLTKNLPDEKRAESKVNVLSTYSREDAVDAIKEKFKDFEGCELIKIWYEESKANLEVERYLTRENNMKRENIIIFYSDFKVDSTGRNPVLNPDSTYTDWMWILTREDITKEWTVKDWGY